MLAPATHDIKAAIGRTQRRDANALLTQGRNPGTIRAQARPATAAHGQHHSICLNLNLARWRIELQKTLCAQAGPARPAVSRVKLNMRAQAAQPRAQQGRGLHVGGEHALRGAHEGVDAQPFGPVADLGRTKLRKPGLHHALTQAITRGKNISRLGMRQVKTALARQQELAAHRGHGIVNRHQMTGVGQHLGRHETRRASADDGNARLPTFA